MLERNVLDLEPIPTPRVWSVDVRRHDVVRPAGMKAPERLDGSRLATRSAAIIGVNQTVSLRPVRVSRNLALASSVEEPVAMTRVSGKWSAAIFNSSDGLPSRWISSRTTRLPRVSRGSARRARGREGPGPRHAESSATACCDPASLLVASNARARVAMRPVLARFSEDPWRWRAMPPKGPTTSRQPVTTKRGPAVAGPLGVPASARRGHHSRQPQQVGLL